MDDSLRRLTLGAAIAALGAGGAAAQGLPASAGDRPIARPHALIIPHAPVPRGASAVRRPAPLPAVDATARRDSGAPVTSGARLEMPTERRASMQRRSDPLTLVSNAAPVMQPGGPHPGGPHPGGPRAWSTQPVATSLTSAQLWRRGEQLTQEAELALRRGALRSAREGAIEALRVCAAAADMHGGRRGAAESLEQATTAIREAGDFVGRYGHVSAADLQRMVDAHQTPVLKGCDASRMNPQAAADFYLDFARERLVGAAGGRREAAAALVVMARAERLQKERAAGGTGGPIGGDVRAVLADAVAITYLRSALETDPANSPVANELGYQAMRLGLLDEAQWALERSWALGPSEPALRNLIETHRLAGNIATAQELAAILPQWAAETQLDGPQVVQLDPGQFAAISPPLQSPEAGIQAAGTVAAGAVAAGARAAGTAPGRGAAPGLVGARQPQHAADAARGETASAVELNDTGADARSSSGDVAPAADESSGVLARVAGAVRRMWQ